MVITTRSSLLLLLLAFAALAPTAALQASEGPPQEVEARLERISQALLERFEGRQQVGSGGVGTGAEGTLVARGFANGGRGGFANGINRGFANRAGYYGGSRGFVNGRGGFVNARSGGGFVNAPRPGVGFVNW